MDCPFCGGTIQRYEIQDSAGERAASLCCGMPQELIDNFDVLSGLPEHLRQVAIKSKKAQYVAMEAQSRENTQRFQECVERYDAKLKRLGQEIGRGIPYDKETADLIASYDV